MQDIEERRKNILIEALQEWHDPKRGNTFAQLAERADLADSTIRDLAKGRRTPSRDTFNVILRLIWPEDKFEQLLNEIEGQSSFFSFKNAKGFGFQIDGPWESWFVISIGNNEKMPVEVAKSVLGANYDAIMSKYVDNGYVVMDNDQIRTANKNNEMLSIKSVKSLSHYAIDKYDSSKGETEHLHVRAIKTSKQKAIRLKKKMAECNKLMLEMAGQEDESEKDEDCCFIFVMSCSVI
ncbi:MAG TPA: helix-turn-helix transcriptional regulator [Oligoflexus sp.]|uniref:helix-turn-helix domain-containing protein n=1 Tax=Oligoflexus sp. TaxID=1971216 RepID=UPI002D5A1752|nr:helix-turn-helix transcriptional regulator [Oligoflexus sp.]HYX39668.1 helix-turn-helix transcriptional regulator [Oligoflexus sp.]